MSDIPRGFAQIGGRRVRVAAIETYYRKPESSDITVVHMVSGNHFETWQGVDEVEGLINEVTKPEEIDLSDLQDPNYD